MSGQELLEVQASQTRTLNGQAAREKLAAAQPTEPEAPALPASTEAPTATPATLPSADPATLKTEQSAPASSELTSEEGRGGEPDVAGEVTVTPAAMPVPAVAAVPAPSTPAVAAAPVTKPRGPGRPSRAAVAAAVPELVGVTASAEESGLKGVIHFKPDVAMQLRQASMDMLSKGKRVTMKQLAEEGALFYLQYLRDNGQLPPMK